MYMCKTKQERIRQDTTGQDRNKDNTQKKRRTRQDQNRTEQEQNKNPRTGQDKITINITRQGNQITNNKTG